MNRTKYLLIPTIMLFVILMVSICILAWVPPVSRDALVHHLAVPKLWLIHGGMYEISHLVFSYYPMNLDLLYVIPLYFGNDIMPKYIHFAFALATSWLIFWYLKHRLHAFWGMLGALFFLSTPVIVKLSITAYVDLGVIFFSTASLFFALKWQAEFPGMRHLILASIFCGLTLGTKYNGLIVLLLMTLLVAWIAAQRLSHRNMISLRIVFFVFVFVCIAMLFYSPWGIRNYLWTGNPIYPFFDGFFNATSPREMQSMPTFVIRKLVYNEPWWKIVLVPFRIFLEGQDDAPRFFDGKLNGYLLVLPVFAFVASGRHRDTKTINFEKRVWLIFSVLLIVIVFFKTDMRIRYIAPAIPGLVILSIFGLKKLSGMIETGLCAYVRCSAQTVLLMAIFLCFVSNALYIKKQFEIVMPFQYLSGKISKDQYIEKFRSEYGVIRFANVYLPPNAKILSLFIGERGYYSNRKMVFDIHLLQSAIQHSESAEEIETKLLRQGFTHLLIRFDMFNNWCNNNLNRKEKQMVNELFAQKKSLVFAKNGHGLYQL